MSEVTEVAASAPAYKPYQVVEGKVAHVLDASEARGKVKAKDQRHDEGERGESKGWLKTQHSKN